MKSLNITYIPVFVHALFFLSKGNLYRIYLQASLKYNNGLGQFIH